MHSGFYWGIGYWLIGNWGNRNIDLYYRSDRTNRTLIVSAQTDSMPRVSVGLPCKPSGRATCNACADTMKVQPSQGIEIGCTQALQLRFGRREIRGRREKPHAPAEAGTPQQPGRYLPCRQGRPKEATCCRWEGLQCEFGQEGD